MEDLNLLIKFPTRNRKDQFLKVYNLYKNNLVTKNVHFVITCDIDDVTMNNNYIKDYFKNEKNVTLYYGNSKTKIEAINADMQDKNFDILLLASDDMIPIKYGYDLIIKNNMEYYYPDTDGVLWFYDGKQNKLNTLSIMGKKYYDRFGYIYNPIYKSFFCDNEFQDIATKLNKITYINECIIEHKHPFFGDANMDSLYKKNDTYHGIDKINYQKRKSYDICDLIKS